MFDERGNEYIFFVQTYFNEFKGAVNRYINDLETGTKNITSVVDALKTKPVLL